MTCSASLPHTTQDQAHQQTGPYQAIAVTRMLMTMSTPKSILECLEKSLAAHRLSKVTNQLATVNPDAPGKPLTLLEALFGSHMHVPLLPYMDQALSSLIVHQSRCTSPGQDKNKGVAVALSKLSFK